MNYYDYTKQFWRSGAAGRLSAGAVVLYWYILDRFNLSRWPERMEIGDKEIATELNTVERSIIRYRKELVAIGLIDYQKGEHANKRSNYSLCTFSEDEISSKTGSKIATGTGDKNDSSTGDKNDSSTGDKNDSSTGDKNDSSTGDKNDIPPTPPYICIQDNNINKTLSTRQRERAREEEGLEKVSPEVYDLDELLPQFFTAGNDEMLRLWASHNDIPCHRLRPLAEEVMVEMKLTGRRFYSYSDAARALQNLMRAKHNHQQNHQNTDAYKTDPDFFGPDPFANLPPDRY